MTQAALSFEVPRPTTATQRVAALFQSKPGEWLSAMDIVKAGGFLSWRTRVSELRRAPYSMQIEWRSEQHGRRKHSFYRWAP